MRLRAANVGGAEHERPRPLHLGQFHVLSRPSSLRLALVCSGRLLLWCGAFSPGCHTAGFHFSVGGKSVRSGADFSCINYINLGCSFCIRLYIRFLSSQSARCGVLWQLRLVSGRAKTRFGSVMRVVSRMQLGKYLSVLESFFAGSNLSVRATGPLGSHVSMMDLLHLGSSAALREYTRLGSPLSACSKITLSSSGACWTLRFWAAPSHCPSISGCAPRAASSRLLSLGVASTCRTRARSEAHFGCGWRSGSEARFRFLHTL